MRESLLSFDISSNKVVYFTLMKNALPAVSFQRHGKIFHTTGTKVALTVNEFPHQHARVIMHTVCRCYLSLLVDLCVVVRKQTSNGNNFSSKRVCYCKEQSSLICLTVCFIRKQEWKTARKRYFDSKYVKAFS